MNFCICLILMFVNVVGALAVNDTILCEMLGTPEFPLLSKKGDIMIGGAFSIYTQITTSLFSLADKPEALLCSKYWFSLFSISAFYLKTKRLNLWTVTFSRINFREFRFAQTMIFAIEEINNSSSLLPNITIGYKIFDSCASTLPTTRAVMALMNGYERTLKKTCSGQSSVHAIIGTSESSTTIAMLQISSIFQMPVVNIKSNFGLYDVTLQE